MTSLPYDYLLTHAQAEQVARDTLQETDAEKIRRLKDETAELRLEVKMLCWTLARLSKGT